MRSRQVVHVVSCHAGGEVGDVIVGGVAPPPGKTLWDQRNFIVRDGKLRNFVLNEPRGGVFRHVNLILPSRHPEAAAAFIIMEPTDTPPMSGSNSICVATVLLETGYIPMVEPVTEFALEAPGGLVHLRAECAGGKAVRIHVRNLPSFVTGMQMPLQVAGLGTLMVDTAFGGDSFVVVDAAALGLSIRPNEARHMAELGTRIIAAADEQMPFRHPTLTDWRHYSFCLFATAVEREGHNLTARHAVAIKPGKIDRSPTGTAVSARLALLAAKGMMNEGDLYTAISIIDAEFGGRIVDRATINGTAAIVPEISGQAWITGMHQHMLDPGDPWPEGYRIDDTWPGV